MLGKASAVQPQGQVPPFFAPDRTRSSQVVIVRVVLRRSMTCGHGREMTCPTELARAVRLWAGDGARPPPLNAQTPAHDRFLRMQAVFGLVEHHGMGTVHDG